MVELVKQKPFKHSKRNFESSNTNQFKKPHKAILKTIWLTTFIIIFFYGLFLLFKITLFSNNNKIQNIIYDPTSIEIYDDPYLYKGISNLIKNENYYIVKYMQKRKILKKISQEFIFIKKFDIKKIGKSEVFVSLYFEQPNFIISTIDMRFAVFEGLTYPIYSGNTIGVGIKNINLPLYIKETDNIDGIFFKTPFFELEKQINILYDFFDQKINKNIKNILYIPGGQKISLTLMDDKKVFFSNTKNLTGQIQNYIYLEKYYNEFDNIKEFDLGSLGENKVIIKK